MKIEKIDIEGVLVITPSVFIDDRGYFFESFNAKKWEDFVGSVPSFVQDNESMSNQGVLRGLHFQRPPFSQGKLIRVVRGSVMDVAVDIRANSFTYGKHFKLILSGENKKQLYIPPGFAHGFLTLEDNTIFTYKCTNYYNKQSEGGLNWNDSSLNIDWGIDRPILSDKDKNYKDFSTFESYF